MSKELLETLTIIAEATKAQLEQQLAVIEALRAAQTPGKVRKVKNASSRRTEPKQESEAERLIKEIVGLCSESPYTKQDLIQITGASDSRVKNSLTRLKGDEFPEWLLENLGTDRRARWFLRPAKR